jgi:UDP-2,3-diacylglucosamine hydrolase
MSAIEAPCPAYFFSDVHLGGHAPELERVKRERLLAFLDLVQSHGRSLFCLGDLFDFWFEYETAIPSRYFAVLRRLQELSESGVRLHFLGGNHDFWVRRGERPGFLEREIGFNVLENGAEVHAGGLRILLFHGDGFGTHDRGYRLLKRLLRNRAAIEAFRWVHPDLARRIGWLVAEASRFSARSGPKPQTVHSLCRFATELLSSRPEIDAVLAGHTHLPEEVPAGRGRYLNLGDWIRNATYAVVEDGVLSLRRFRAAEREGSDSPLLHA